MNNEAKKYAKRSDDTRFWVAVQGADVSIIESVDAPETASQPGERMIELRGAYSARELAEQKAEKLRSMKVAGQNS